MAGDINDKNYMSGSLCEFSKNRLLHPHEKQEQRKINGLKQAQKCEYKHWLQFNIDMTPQWIALNSDHPSAANVFLFIISEMDKYNNLMCNQQVISDAIGVSLSTVTKSLVVLKKRRFLKITKWGNTNVYHVNAEIVWKSWSENRDYAEFAEPDVLFSDDEKNV